MYICIEPKGNEALAIASAQFLVYIYGNVPLIRDKENMIKCILRVFGSNTMNYSMNYFTFLFVSL